LGRLLLGVLVTLALYAAAVANAKDKIIQVDCDDGKTLTQALYKADPGETTRVAGTCHERVTMTTDRITLDGQGTAVLDGGGGGPSEFSGVVTIDGARGVTLTGLTIQNGHGEGILGRRGAAFTVQHSTVQHNAGTGIAVESSRADLTEVTMQNNAIGLDVFTSSSVILRGAITATNNGSGIEVNGQSVLEIRGAHVQASHNGGSGVTVGSGQLAIFGFSSSAGSTLTADGNGFAGIFLGGSPLTAFAPCTITASNNVFGIFLGAAVISSPNGSSQFVIENNVVGLRFGTGSGAVFLGGPLTVRNNGGTGLLADGAGTLPIVSDPPGASVIQNNGTDVDLRFGTRADFQGVAIGTIVCDATVLSRGTTVCP